MKKPLGSSDGEIPAECARNGNAPSSKLTVAELEEHFRRFTKLIYDTSVPIATLEKGVYPYLANRIEFKDPLAHIRGIRKYKIGLRGFHCITHFDFDIFQLHVQMNERGDGGRVLIDGIMNLRQLGFYTYPLRTILVYEFVLTEGGESFEITLQEEMWSLGDLIENLPWLGKLYDSARWATGSLLVVLFWLSCIIAPQR